MLRQSLPARGLTAHRPSKKYCYLAVLLTGLLSACASGPELKPINTLKAIDRPETPRIIVLTEAEAHKPLAEAQEGAYSESEATIWTDPVGEHRASKSSRRALSVGFKIGEYRYAESGEITKLLSALPKDPASISLEKIEVTGHSRSRTNLATERLALKRAKIVKQALVDYGVPASLIEMTTDVRNYQDKVGHYPGATVAITEFPLVTPEAPFTPPVQLAEGVAGGIPLTVGQSEEGLKEGKPQESLEEVAVEKPQEIIIHTDPVYVLHVEQGSLKASIKEILADYGYSLGAWSFAEPGVHYDWDIPAAYHYPLMGGLPKVFEVLGRLYGFQTIINELDKTVDFQPAGEMGS